MADIKFSALGNMTALGGTEKLVGLQGGVALNGTPAQLNTYVLSLMGTGVATALGVNVGSAGAPVLFNGAGGTPSSLTGTNITGTAAGLTAGIATKTLGIGTSGATVVGSAAAPPTTGQVPTATSATTFDWQTPAGGGTVTHTGALTANAVVLGNGTDDIKPMASLGTTTTVLHGNAAGAPTFGAVNLATDVTGTIPVVINAQTGTTYVVVAGDQSKLVTDTNVSATAVTLPQATGSFTTGWGYSNLNLGAGLVTVTPTTSTFNGLSSAALKKYIWISAVSDGTNYVGISNLYSGTTYALQSATTTVDVSAATAPTNGQVLTATGGSAATWQTPSGGSSSPSISGIELAFNSTTVLRVKAGTAVVNSTNVAFSQTDYTSGSTMKDIANSTVTLAADKSYWVFLSSGGVIGIEVNDGTGDGATPVFDTTLDYWKSASTGAAWRRIGTFWTNGSAQIMKFYIASGGRLRKTYLAGTADCPILVNGVANASVTAVTITPYYTGDMSEMLLVLNALNASTGALSAGMGVYVDGGTSPQAFIYFNIDLAAAANSIQTSYQNTTFPYTGTLHYATLGSAVNSTIGYIYALGFSQFV